MSSILAVVVEGCSSFVDAAVIYEAPPTASLHFEQPNTAHCKFVPQKLLALASAYAVAFLDRRGAIAADSRTPPWPGSSGMVPVG